MIRELRRRHRFLVPTLWIPAGGFLVLGFAARGMQPDDSVPFGAGEERTEALTTGATRLGDSPAAARIVEGDEGPMLELIALEPLSWPTLFVYWSAQDPSAGDAQRALPSDALQLGRFGARGVARYPLPPDARAGYVILFSVGHAERVAHAKVGG